MFWFHLLLIALNLYTGVTKSVAGEQNAFAWFYVALMWVVVMLADLKIKHLVKAERVQ